MLFVRRGIDLATYPAVARHLARFRDRLEPRPADWQPRTDGERWPGRKAGRYAWYELQDSVDYFASFERPKLVHTDIAWAPQFAYAPEPLYPLNTVYVWPTDDLYVLGVLNSPLLWWYSWRHAQHGKDEVLRLFSTYTATIPIAEPTEDVRLLVEENVRALIIHAGERRTQRRTLLDWLRVEFGVETAGEKLGAFDELTEDAFLGEVKRRRAGAARVTPAELRRLRGVFIEAVAPLRGIAYHAAARERSVGDAVMTAYSLTPAEIDLVWRTAPPRTPLALEGNERADTDSLGASQAAGADGVGVGGYGR